MTQLDILCAGEVMVEFCRTGVASEGDAGTHHWQQSFAGDTYNTAVYLARGGLRTGYMTFLGDDEFSTRLMQQMAQESINTEAVHMLSGRTMGLYSISNDASGERSFSYWRGQSPARNMFDSFSKSQSVLPGCKYFYFSGITVAVIADTGFDNFVSCLELLRDKGAMIVFDPNYRPRLWGSVVDTRSSYESVLPLCDIVLPTFEDEAALWGFTRLEECIDFYRQYNLQELVLKAPDLSCHTMTGNDYQIFPTEPVEAVDTTGAGDAFNGGYLASRLQNSSVEQAVSSGQVLAAKVVQHRGAILP